MPKIVSEVEHKYGSKPENAIDQLTVCAATFLDISEITMKTVSIEIDKDVLSKAIAARSGNVFTLARRYKQGEIEMEESLTVECGYSGGGCTLSISRGPRRTNEPDTATKESKASATDQ